MRLTDGYQKFGAALLGALVLAGTLLADGFTTQDGIAIAVSFLTALGVKQVENAPAGRDAGEGTVDLVIKVALALLILAFAVAAWRHFFIPNPRY